MFGGGEWLCCWFQSKGLGGGRTKERPANPPLASRHPLLIFNQKKNYTDDVNAIVIDIGSSTVKAGYAGEDAPKAIYPSVRSQSAAICFFRRRFQHYPFHRCRVLPLPRLERSPPSAQQ